MHITLVEPPKYYSPTNPVSTVATPPLGLAYIAASLEAVGNQVHVVDAVGQGLTTYRRFGQVYLRGLAFEQICAQIPRETDLIGIGCMFSGQWPMVRELIKEIRGRFSRVPLVLGGEHGTGLADLSMEQAPLDVIVMGEGEETIVEVARHFENGLPLEGIPGIVYRTGERWRSNSRRARIAAIDDIPLPAWHLFDVEAYTEFNQPHGASRGRFMPMLATRGCPYQCTFCTNPQMWTQRWIARDPQRVVDEMELYMQKYNATDFQFEDLTAIVRKDWIIEFCRIIQQRRLHLTFQLPSGTRSEAVDEEVAQALKRAGCHEFSFAPESGDPEVLHAIKKRVSLDRMFRSARSAMRAGINVGGFFIIGFPEDTYRSILRTWHTIAKCALLGFSSVNVNAYSPQPNTASFRDLVAKGKIGNLNDGYLLSLFTFQDLGRQKTSYNDRFSHGQITLFILIAFAIFYTLYFLSRPIRILGLFRDLFRKTSTNKTSKYLSSVLKDLVSLKTSDLTNYFRVQK